MDVNVMWVDERKLIQCHKSAPKKKGNENISMKVSI
jgi:hypothetical protein